ncbi:hypothetical protein OG607_03650 [Streptomyces sp. NBC_01537]|uniref:hypothetical protein n=1 Tax=Streptomyces sp. NBC_01537 TaxID=2903896 RepID=UPI003870BC1B
MALILTAASHASPAHQEQVDNEGRDCGGRSQTLVLTSDKEDSLATATCPVTVDPTSTLAVTTDTRVQNPDYPDSQVPRGS